MALFFESILMEVIVGVLTLLLLLAWVYYSSFSYWKRKGVPYVWPKSVFGNMRDLVLQRENLGEALQRYYWKFSDKPFCGVYFGRKPALIIREPDLIKQILVKDFASFHDRTVEINEEANPLDANLLFLKGERWRSLRSKLTPTFTSGKIKMMFNVMRECAEELNAMLEEVAANQQDVEIRDLSAKFTTDIIGTCAFGLQCNAMKNPQSEFREMGRQIFATSTDKTIKRYITQSNPTLTKILGISIFDHSVTGFFRNVVKEAVEYREKNNYARKDFLQMLIDLKNKGKVDDDRTSGKEDAHLRYHVIGDKDSTKFEMTDELLAAQSFVFFLAGFETSSTTMSFCLYELALNTDIQDRLREEVDSVLSRYGGKTTYEAIQEMEYLSRVVDETLRKYPPVPALSRSCTKPYTIPDTTVTVDEKANVFIPVYALHHDPQYYPEPERFDPDRFTEDAKHARHHYVYLPFGEGPRICIGMRFGLMQTKVGLASLITKYQFSPCEKTDIPLKIDPQSGIVISPVGGIWLKISPRDINAKPSAFK